MNDPANALLAALLKITYLIQLGFYRSALGTIRYIRARRWLMWVVYFTITLGPFILFALLVTLIGLEVADWIRES